MHLSLQNIAKQSYIKGAKHYDYVIHIYAEHGLFPTVHVPSRGTTLNLPHKDIQN